MVGGLTRSPALAPQSVSLADGVLFNPTGPVIFWACAGTWDHCSNAERNSPTVESSPRVIVVLLLPYVTSKVNILANQHVNFLRSHSTTSWCAAQKHRIREHGHVRDHASADRDEQQTHRRAPARACCWLLKCDNNNLHNHILNKGTNKQHRTHYWTPNARGAGC